MKLRSLGATMKSFLTTSESLIMCVKSDVSVQCKSPSLGFVSTRYFFFLGSSAKQLHVASALTTL